MYSENTIIALSTPEGIGAIGVIRISGKKSFLRRLLLCFVGIFDKARREVMFKDPTFLGPKTRFFWARLISSKRPSK